MSSLLVVLKLLWVAGPGGDVVCLAHIDIVYQAHALADGTAADFSLGATYLDGGRPGGEQGRDGRAGSLLQYAVDIEAILGQMDGEELRVVIKLHVQLGLRIESLVDPAAAESLAEFLSPAGSVGQLVGGWDIIEMEVVALPVLYFLSEGDDILQGRGASRDVEDYLQALLREIDLEVFARSSSVGGEHPQLGAGNLGDVQLGEVAPCLDKLRFGIGVCGQGMDSGEGPQQKAQ